jgi:hypothetical protein
VKRNGTRPTRSAENRKPAETDVHLKHIATPRATAQLPARMPMGQILSDHLH